MHWEQKNYSHPARPSCCPPFLPHADRGSFAHLVQVVIESLWGRKGGREVSGLWMLLQDAEAYILGHLSSED